MQLISGLLLNWTGTFEKGHEYPPWIQKIFHYREFHSESFYFFVILGSPQLRGATPQGDSSRAASPARSGPEYESQSWAPPWNSPGPTLDFQSMRLRQTTMIASNAFMINCFIIAECNGCGQDNWALKSYWSQTVRRVVLTHPLTAARDPNQPFT